MEQYALLTWLAVALLGGAVFSTNPGLKLRLSQPGLNYAASVAMDILAGKVSQLSIPDQHGSADIKVGKVSYDVTNMKITNFVKPGTDVVVSPGDMTWRVSNAGVSVHGNWHYQYRMGFIKISDSGSFDANANGVSVSVSITLGLDSTGRPTISTTGCSCSVNDVHITLHGGASWLYDLFTGFVRDPLRKSLQNIICDSARKAIDENARKELETLQVEVTIDNDWLLDYRLVAPPSLVAGYLESFHKGEFFLKSHPTEAPFQAPSLPEPQTTETMATIWISDYILNTAGYVLYNQGILAYVLTKKDLPDLEKGFLNTSCSGVSVCFGKFIIQVAEKYPNASVEMQMLVTESPTVEIGASDINGSFVGIITYNARLADGSLAYLFKTKLIVKVALNVSMDGTTIKAKVDSLNPSINVTDSAVGPISSTILQWAFNVAKMFVIPKLNEVGAKGFPLPMISGVQFVNTNLALGDRSVCLKTNVKYVGPRENNVLYFKSHQ